MTMIPLANAFTSNQEFSNHPCRDRVLKTIKHGQARIGQGSANRGSKTVYSLRLFWFDECDGRSNSTFGWSIMINQLKRQASGRIEVKRIPCGEQKAQGSLGRPG